MVDLLITNIGLLATPVGSHALSGIAQGDIQFIKNAAIGITGEKISYVGDMENTPNAGDIIDVGGRLVTPGLVDAHTHLVFGGFRQHELEYKLAGMSYMDILKSGGGILSTVETTRKTTRESLVSKSSTFLNAMLAHGTTTVEIKSGYGLDLETELKQLEVINDLSKNFNVVPTFMGAHTVPTKFKDKPDAYVDIIINEMLPLIAELKLAKYCDIFCEKSVFDIKQSRRILTAARKQGLEIKIHADEIEPLGGAGLAAELRVVSAEHLLQASDADLSKMAENGVIAVLLPATSFYLDKNYARARDMIEKGIPVAVASDFNPGSSPNYNLQFILNLACLKLKLTPSEALTSATLNAAAAIGYADTKGSLETGKDADIVIWDCPDLNFLFYRYGNNQVYQVLKGGCIYADGNKGK
jgi:imidazolonepropionase